MEETDFEISHVAIFRPPQP